MVTVLSEYINLCCLILAYIMLEILEDVYMYLNKYVTQCEKIGLMYTKYTHLYYCKLIFTTCKLHDKNGEKFVRLLTQKVKFEIQNVVKPFSHAVSHNINFRWSLLVWIKPKISTVCAIKCQVCCMANTGTVI